MVFQVRWLSSRLPYQCKSKFGKGFRWTCNFQWLERRCQKNDGLDLNLDESWGSTKDVLFQADIKIISLLYMYFVWLIIGALWMYKKFSSSVVSWQSRDDEGIWKRFKLMFSLVGVWRPKLGSGFRLGLSWLRASRNGRTSPLWWTRLLCTHRWRRFESIPMLLDRLSQRPESVANNWHHLCFVVLWFQKVTSSWTEWWVN